MISEAIPSLNELAKALADPAFRSSRSQSLATPMREPGRSLSLFLDIIIVRFAAFKKKFLGTGRGDVDTCDRMNHKSSSASIIVYRTSLATWLARDGLYSSRGHLWGMS